MDTFVLDLLVFMLKEKICTNYTNLFSLNQYRTNDKIILENFNKLETKNLFYE